jgi:hypothetical protein
MCICQFNDRVKANEVEGWSGMGAPGKRRGRRRRSGKVGFSSTVETTAAKTSRFFRRDVDIEGSRTSKSAREGGKRREERETETTTFSPSPLQRLVEKG